MPPKHARRNSDANSDAELARYRKLLSLTGNSGLTEDLLNAPLFSWSVKRALSGTPAAFVQYALLGHERAVPRDVRLNGDHQQEDGDSDSASAGTKETEDGVSKVKESVPLPPSMTKKNTDPEPEPELLFLNTNAPFSAFLCGAQGSGKSHTLSCILEGCLLREPAVAGVGRLAQPLAAIVFHYDEWSSCDSGSGGICEAAHLATQGVKVRVLVSPCNYWALKWAYRRGVKDGKVEVGVLRLRETDLNVKRMSSLMAFDGKEGKVPLYMEVIHRILRDMAITAQGRPGFDYSRFKQLLDAENLSPTQRGPLNLRLQLLKSFMDCPESGDFTNTFNGTATESLSNPEPGTLTIVDLSDPLIDPSTACTLFDVSLSLFLEHGASSRGRVIALDEAHKCLSTSSDTASSAAAACFTSSLLKIIRMQRHEGIRIIIATQEPSVDTRLLDLCSLTIVHRFGSPAWMEVLGKHLAAGRRASRGLASHVDDNDGARKNSDEVFDEIVQMGVGECLVFCPTGIVRVAKGVVGRDDETAVKNLGSQVLRCKTRARVSSDGGRSELSVRETGDAVQDIVGEQERRERDEREQQREQEMREQEMREQEMREQQRREQEKRDQKKMEDEKREQEKRKQQSERDKKEQEERKQQSERDKRKQKKRKQQSKRDKREQKKRKQQSERDKREQKKREDEKREQNKRAR